MLQGYIIKTVTFWYRFWGFKDKISDQPFFFFVQYISEIFFHSFKTAYAL